MLLVPADPPHRTMLTALSHQAMIADLKADSARWEQERRNHSGGTLTSHDSSAFLMRSSKSNSPPARYSDSQNRFSGAGLSQYDTSGATYPSGPSRDSYESVPRYPGSDAPGYSASTGSQPYHQDNRQQQPGAYGAPAYPQYPQAQDNRFPPGSASAYGSAPNAYSNSHPTQQPMDPHPYYAAGANLVTAPQQHPSHHRSQDPYQDSRDPSRNYATPASAYGPSSQGYYSTPQAAAAYPAQPTDMFAGRTAYGSTSQAEILGSSSSQAPMYDRQYEPQPPYENQTPPPPRPVASSSSQAQTGHSGSSHSRRSDRERDRDDRPRRR